MLTPFKVAAVEFNPELFEFERNIKGACAIAEQAAANGAKLIVLPEAALSGYIYRDLDQFLPYMDTVPGRGTDAIAEVCAKHGCHVAIGIAEVDPITRLTYNTGALVGPDGYLGKYRKNGLNPSDVMWFTPGNTGYPVFDTELGRICMIICYDDTYWEPARLPALKGADLIAYICSSDRVLTQLGAESKGNHSTIAAVQQLVAWNGLAMVASDRNNVESNPATGISVVYGGSASIWQADGRRTGHLPATDQNLTAANPGSILYGEIDPGLYANDQRATLRRRRPELYGDLAFYRAPTDTQASRRSHELTVTAMQYGLVAGDSAGNIERANVQVLALPADAGDGLVVFPAFTVSGVPADAEAAADMAESGLGRTVQVLSDFAVRLQRFVVGSHVERAGDALFHTAVLIEPNGKVVGSYRQCHLDPAYTWATAGDDLPVFDTAIGRIGMLLCEDTRFPEASGVLAMRRADLIAIPTNWDGSYGGPLQESEGLFAHGFPSNTMCLWYAVAKTSQAYTVVANSVGSGAQGSSGVFTINPVDAQPPSVASVDDALAVSLDISTRGNPDWWMDQQRLIAGRRTDLVAPLVLADDSAAFTTWRDGHGYDLSSWTAYSQ
ncbi:nitrilase-related carbon-nitrogen hydrolase [Mycolicibacterium hodleri]|uniref:nitrilase-related carbon-nitrogen hydrolase n=1 Tax=Mycolicibacterium hodleri TaxID=49897 RepID=UPI00112DA76D|nr:nitrilase-related carbon-nitrogen hydrolase [Mycolicibacterium hodleri]